MKAKRIMAWMVAAVLLLSLCGCRVGPIGGTVVSQDALDIPLPLPTASYGNHCQRTEVTASGDTLFLSECLAGLTPEALIRGALWAYRDGKRAKVFDFHELGVNRGINGLFVAGSTLYFVSNGGFYAFDLETKTKQLILESDKSVWDWQITDGHAAYTTYDEELYLYDRRTGQTVLLAQDVQSYCFVGDVLRYAVGQSAYVFYEYGLATGVTKDLFTVSLSEDGGFLRANYTQDLIVVQNDTASASELWVYTLDGEKTVYALPKNTYCDRFVLTQSYAYVQGSESQYDGERYHYTYTIHRVDLKTGECERLMETSQEMGFGAMYVVSDDCLYYVCDSFTLIGQYVRQLYRFDIAENRHVKLMEY